MAKEEYRTIRISNRLHRLMSKPPDYELVPFVINRVRMYLGLKKQKKIRHHVRFEGMITPLSRGSSFVEFDDLDFDQRSEYTEIEDCFITDSESALTKISDSSVWTSSKLGWQKSVKPHFGTFNPSAGGMINLSRWQFSLRFFSTTSNLGFEKNRRKKKWFSPARRRVKSYYALKNRYHPSKVNRREQFSESKIWADWATSYGLHYHETDERLVAKAREATEPIEPTH